MKGSTLAWRAAVPYWLGALLFWIGAVRFYSAGDMVGAILFGATGLLALVVGFIGWRNMKRKLG